MKRTVRSGVAAFRPRARLLKLIGSELISDDVLAITELVKNSYDADATFAEIEFRDVSDGQGEIVVRDDGCGMDLDVLLESWMQPAGTTKASAGGRRTPAGRRMLGEKGVGRFATDKLGRHLELVSRMKGESTEVRAVFDWDAFENEQTMLSDVKMRWELRSAPEISPSGTVLRISGLRSPWTERMFRRLSTRLSRLINPFSALDNFSIRIDSDEFPHYSGELRPEILERAPYHIEACFDGADTVSISVNGGSAGVHRWNGEGDLACGPVRVELFAFDLETDAVARIGPRMEVRAWLREWSGISVYRDGFRVWPYGEPHDDWLRLDQRRVNNPVVRLSNNQVIGFVEISADRNSDLRDQTSREGLLHNTAYDDLRRLMIFVLQILEAGRQRIRHPREVSRPGAARTASRPGTGIASSSALEDSRFVLAALGQASLGITDGLSRALDLARVQAQDLGRRSGLKPGEIRSRYRKLEETLESISLQLSLLASIQPGSNRRRTVDIGAEVLTAAEYLRPRLDAHGITLEADVPRKGTLRSEMRPEDLHQMLNIVVQNSVDWMKGNGGGRIRVQGRLRDGFCALIVSDTGPGIDPSLADSVFDPGFSGKERGRGMGLAIARDLAGACGGSIRVLTDRRRRGASIEILLPRKRSRATLGRRKR